ncbi:hypothetical protein ASG41_19670 [Modestobacter sp. Leaf380]|nr:hypothetical protein ASG41_19670 [Modestobacter sp. Leaf380]
MSLATTMARPFVAGDEAGQLLADAAADRLPRVVVVSGAGGTGKSWLLGRVAEALRARGQVVVGPGEEPRPARTARTPLTVLLDDAHRLTTDDAASLRRQLRRPAGRVLLAARPAPSAPAWWDLLADLPRDRAVVHRTHLDEADVARWVHHSGPDDVDPAALAARTGGLPVLVGASLGRSPAGDRAVRAWAAAELATLPRPAAAVLALVGDGVPWEEDLLAEVLATPLGDVVAACWASGLVRPDGTLLPVALTTVAATLPAARTHGWRRRALSLLHEQGRVPPALARAVAARGADPSAAAALADLARARVQVDPGAASDLLDEAVAAGAPASSLAGLRARAAAGDGRVDLALAAVREHPDGQLAATLLAAAGEHRAAARAVPGSGAAALVGALTGRTGDVGPDPDDTQARTAAALLATTCPAAGDDVTEQALASLTRAQALAPGGPAALLVDSPAAVGAVLALHTGDPGTARQLLTRALATATGGPLLTARHRLLLGWSALRSDDPATAHDHLRAVEPGPGRRLTARDELWAAALSLVLHLRTAQESSAEGWERVRDAVRAHPVDLLGLPVLAELQVATATSAEVHDGAATAVRVAVAEGSALLAGLADPAPWSAGWHWAAVRAASTGAAAGEASAGLDRAGRHGSRARELAALGRVWADVLTGTSEPATVTASVSRLVRLGLTAESRDLAGRAALRTGPGRDRTELLRRAREAAPAPGARLSGREVEVARLLLAGRTHAQIGARLFLSPRTVEHHVARMRRRLGAGGRADLLDRLSRELDAGP